MQEPPNSRIFSALLDAAASGALLHAYILCGAAPMAHALRIASAHLRLPGSLSVCPDFHLLSQPKVSEIRALELDLARRPFGVGHVIVLDCADPLTEQVQNALLKTLEEPSANTLFLLLGEPNAFLPTVRSRCAFARFPAASSDETMTTLLESGVEPESARLFSGLFPPETALEYAGNPALRAARISALEAVSALLGEKRPSMFLALAKEDFSSVFAFLLSYAGDLLRFKLGRGILNLDFSVPIRSQTALFTMRGINDIIDLVVETQKRKLGNANLPLLLDRFIIMLSEVL